MAASQSAFSAALFSIPLRPCSAGDLRYGVAAVPAVARSKMISAESRRGTALSGSFFCSCTTRAGGRTTGPLEPHRDRCSYSIQLSVGVSRDSLIGQFLSVALNIGKKRYECEELRILAFFRNFLLFFDQRRGGVAHPSISRIGVNDCLQRHAHIGMQENEGGDCQE